MEVLLEYKTSQHPLKLPGGVVTRLLIEDELKKAGWDGCIDVHDAMSTHEMDEARPPLTTKMEYILQRWEQKWNCFIDVASMEEVKEGDKLTVVVNQDKNRLVRMEPQKSRSAIV